VVTLRPADLSDEERLLEWRNEPTTRAASLTEGVVAPEDHGRWLRRKLADPDCALYVVLAGTEPVGQVRLDRVGEGVAEVSIGLAPEARGRGAGREALRLAETEAGERLGATTLRALVKPDNEPSLRAFAAAGYSEVSRSDDVVELHRELGQSVTR
jgi:RimJ/RimL family protein N-acetyltransferase